MRLPTVVKGRVWSFTAEPVSYPLTSVTVTASGASVGMGPEKTIDGSGLSANDEHSTEPTQMWLTSKTGPQPVWIQYAFDKVYRLDKMWVWNSNQVMESMLGFGAKNVTVEYSTDGTTWTTLGDFEFAQASAAADLYRQHHGQFRRGNRQVREADHQEQLGRHCAAVRPERGAVLLRSRPRPDSPIRPPGRRA